MMTGNFVMRMRRGKEMVGSREAEKRVTEMTRETKREKEKERWKRAVGYENFSDVVSPRFMIFHRTAAESGE